MSLGPGKLNMNRILHCVIIVQDGWKTDDFHMSNNTRKACRIKIFDELAEKGERTKRKANVANTTYIDAGLPLSP